MNIEVDQLARSAEQYRSKKVTEAIRLVSVVALLHSCTLDDSGSDGIPEISRPVRVDNSELQADESALSADVAILAKEVGVTSREILDAHEFQQRFSQLSDKLRSLFPNSVAGIWMASVPDQVGYIRFVGKTPELADSIIRRFENSTDQFPSEPQSDRSSAGHVRVLEDGSTPWSVQRLRTRAIIEFLKREQEVEAASTWYDVERNKIVAQISSAGTWRASDSSRLVRKFNSFLLRYGGSLPASIQSVQEMLPLTVDDIDVSELRDEDRLDLYSGIGGLSMGSSESLACTSGWASRKQGVGTGVTTAGHCENVTELWHPGGKEERLKVRLHSWTRNFDGDIAFYTTSGRAEPVFYANDIVKRRVRSKVRDENMIGRRVCSYGRMTRKRTCNHKVVALNQSYFVRLGKNRFLEVGFLAKATNDSSSKGDSGGGVSFSTSAFGTIVGGTGKNLYFYTIDEAERELGIETLLDNG